MTEDRIFHVALAQDWHAAQARGEYTISTRGRTLAEVGFIHASYASQAIGVANAFYAGLHGLVLLVIAPHKLTAPVREELPYDGAHEHFPHIYGPLNLDAVIDVVPLTADNEGMFKWPRQLDYRHDTE
jgi:glutathione S-transferase